MSRPLRVAVVARSVLPLHGVGGLERHVYDLVRYLAAHDVEVTLITQPPTRAPAGLAHRGRRTASTRASSRFYVPYRTFPFAGRRGTTILDRSTAYPLFGERAGRLALELVREGHIDIVHGLRRQRARLRASARRRSRRRSC